MPDRTPRDRDASGSPARNATSVVAAAASALVPGAGQLYNRQFAKGISLVLLAGLSAVLTVTGVGVLAYLLVWGYAIYDAYQRGTTSIRLPEGVAFWRGLAIAVPGSFLLGVGAVFELFLLGAEPPAWARELVVLGGLLLVLGPGWYWVARPLYRRLR